MGSDRSGNAHGYYETIDHSPRFIPVVLDAQLISGSFEYVLDYQVDHQLDLDTLDRSYCNDDTGSTAYDPRVIFKIIVLADGSVVTAGSVNCKT